MFCHYAKADSDSFFTLKDRKEDENGESMETFDSDFIVPYADVHHGT